MTQNIVFNINIGDQLTSISCGHVIVELIKFLAYQRLQIPYTYQWLKQMVNKKKDNENEKDTYQSERHFHIASTALNNLDFVLKAFPHIVPHILLPNPAGPRGECDHNPPSNKSLLKEIGEATQPQEVCIAFGSSPISCKEIYRIVLPTVCHKPQCQSPHIASDKKIQSSVFRNLVTSEKLCKVFFEPLSPTNMYVFLKKELLSNQQVVCSDTFLHVNGYRMPRSCKVVVLNFPANPKNTTCCNDFKIFGNAPSEDLSKLSLDDTSDDDFHEIESTDKVQWFQSTYVMKGFKDCVVNGSSIINSWLH
ncbi:uncharacterized protein LOC125054395 isoform X1 [Pieris napi]|uniref:uncharacterized protein LOC125054395 isoform X1 n=1 Tax=Pieris napi TaxID=78633 RepID=UPI001FB879C3|nr:uncharacterized protein LOC125054395 isoform X1 [Pieris napi]